MVVNSVKPHSNAMDDLDQVVGDWLGVVTNGRSLPGLSVAVRAGEVETSWTFGVTSQQARTPIASSTQFDVASQSKVVLLVALLRLVETDRFDLHEPLRKHVPDVWGQLPDEVRDLTAWHVLTHQSRFPRDEKPRSSAETVRELVLESIEYSGLNETPAYSNLAYALLALAVEAATGRQLEELLTTEVLKPLNMTNSSWAGAPNGRRAEPYGPEMGGERRPVHQASQLLRGAINLWSTPTDLCRLFGVFSNAEEDGFLTSRSKLMVLASQWRLSATEFGIGLQVQQMAGRPWYGHSGGAPGFVSATYYNRALDVAFSIATNGRDIDAVGGVAASLAQLVGLFYSSHTATTDFEDACGVYKSNLGYSQVISTPRGTFLVDPNQWFLFTRSYRLKRTDADEARLVDEFSLANMRVVFERDAGGDVATLLQGQFIFDRCR